MGQFNFLNLNIPFAANLFSGSLCNFNFGWNSGFCGNFTSAFGSVWGSESVAPMWLQPMNWIQSLKYQNNSIMNFAPMPSNYAIGDTFNYGRSVYTPTYTGGRSSSSKTESAEEKAEKTTYNNLKGLLTAYANYIDDLDLKEDIKDIVADKSLTIAEKTDALKTLKDESISSETFVSYLKNHSNVKFDNKKVSDILDEIGYEASNDELTGLTLGYDTVKDVPVMKIVSAYNTGSNNIIEDALKISDNNERLRTLQLLRNNLIAEAKVQANNLAERNEYYSQLEKMNVTDKNFASEFNKVYAYTRIISVKAFSNMIYQKYGISESILADKTEADLSNEKGVSAKDVNDALALKFKDKCSMSKTKIGKVKLTGNNKEKLDALVSSGHLTEDAEVTIDGLDYRSYRCITGDTYIYRDGEIHKITKTGNVWTDSGKINPTAEFEDESSALQKKLKSQTTANEQSGAEDKILQEYPALKADGTSIYLSSDNLNHSVYKLEGSNTKFIIVGGKLQKITREGGSYGAYVVNNLGSNQPIYPFSSNNPAHAKYCTDNSYEYESFEPEYTEAKKEDIEKIVLNAVSTNITKHGTVKIENQTYNIYTENTLNKVFIVFACKIYEITGVTYKHRPEDKYQLTYYINDININEPCQLTTEQCQQMLIEMNPKDLKKSVSDQAASNQAAVDRANAVSQGAKSNYSIHCRR